MANNYLVLEDGTVLEGEAFGYDKANSGEVVFTTAMGGYQESVTDPSYCGQILISTYPLIGNYGIMDSANQSDDVWVRGLVVREYSKTPSLMYGGRTIDDFLKEHKVPGISGIDTRELVLKISSGGTLKGAIVTDESKIDSVISDLKRMPAPSEGNLVAEVSCKQAYSIDNKKKLTVGVIDCGVKNGIIDSLSRRFNLRVFPYDVTAQESTDRANKRCRATAIEVMRRDVHGYETVSSEGSSVRLRGCKVHYALMPVWTLRTRWQGKDYLFMMNGQTGKMVGDLPMSKAKSLAIFGALSVLFSALALWAGVGQWIAALFMA